MKAIEGLYHIVAYFAWETTKTNQIIIWNQS